MTSALNNYFDKVFVINLRRDVLRKERVVARFAKAGISFDFFEGVNGSSFAFSREWNFYSTRPECTALEMKYGKKFIESQGAWGYLKTMISLLAHSLKMQYERILVFDDDIFLAYDLEHRFDNFISFLPNQGWKLLLLGASQYVWLGDEKYPYYKPTKFATCGSFAVAYDRSIIYKIIEEAAKMESAYDNLPLGLIYEGYPNQCFVAYPNMIIADVRESAIRGPRNLASHGQKMKWSLEEFDIS